MSVRRLVPLNLPALPALPATATVGDLVFYQVNGHIYLYNGAAWVDVSESAGGGGGGGTDLAVTWWLGP